MLSGVPHGRTSYYADGDDPTIAMKRYQTDQGLPTNVGVGERTRRALIRDYMDADETTLREGATLTVHGCGPYFPDVQSGPNEDVPQNRQSDVIGSRQELGSSGRHGIEGDRTDDAGHPVHQERGVARVQKDGDAALTVFSERRKCSLDGPDFERPIPH